MNKPTSSLDSVSLADSLASGRGTLPGCRLAVDSPQDQSFGRHDTFNNPFNWAFILNCLFLSLFLVTSVWIHTWRDGDVREWVFCWGARGSSSNAKNTLSFSLLSYSSHHQISCNNKINVLCYFHCDKGHESSFSLQPQSDAVPFVFLVNPKSSRGFSEVLETKEICALIVHRCASVEPLACEPDWGAVGSSSTDLYWPLLTSGASLVLLSLPILWTPDTKVHESVTTVSEVLEPSCLAPVKVDSIQFSLFCVAQYHNLQICLRGLYNLYTYDIPDLWPHTGSGKKLKQNFHGGKKVRTLQESRSNRCHVTRWTEWQSYMNILIPAAAILFLWTRNDDDSSSGRFPKDFYTFSLLLQLRESPLDAYGR